MPRKQPPAKQRPAHHQGLRVVSRAGTTTLYLRGTVRGRSIRESTGTDNPALAEEARAAREAELYRAAIHGEPKKPKTVTFAQAAFQYLSRPADDHPVSKHTAMAIARVVKHFGPTITCDQIDQDAVDAAGRALCSKTAKAVTVLRAVITPTKAVLGYASRRGWCRPPAFEAVRGGGRRTDWFTPAEAEALIAAAAAHLKPLLTFLFCTGARMGEAVALDWRNVDLKYGRVTFLGQSDTGARTKNGDDRTITLPPRAVAALASLPGDRTGRVFLAPDGNPKTAKAMVPYRLSGDNKFGSGGGQIKRSWATAMSAAGIKRRLTPHHTRHTWATWHFLVHNNVVRLRLEGGWRTASQWERYTKLAPDGLRDEAAAFWAGGVKGTESAHGNNDRSATA